MNNCQYCNTPIDENSGVTCQCDEARLAQLDQIEKILDSAGIPVHDNQAVRTGELVLMVKRRDEQIRKLKTAKNSPSKRQSPVAGRW